MYGSNGGSNPVCDAAVYEDSDRIGDGFAAGCSGGGRYFCGVLFDELIEFQDNMPFGAAMNMAFDEALLEEVRAPALRVYRWERPAVSFGYFMKYNSVAAAWPGRDLVRRMTGGGLVLHGEDVTYTLVIPSKHPLFARSPREIYREVHAVIAGLLAEDGDSPLLAAAPVAAGNGACFESPVEHDVIVRGKKIAGAAMRRTRHGLLLQGSIQGARDNGMLRCRLARAFGRHVDGLASGPALIARAAALAASKYSTVAWTERV